MDGGWRPGRSAGGGARRGRGYFKRVEVESEGGRCWLERAKMDGLGENEVDDGRKRAAVRVKRSLPSLQDRVSASEKVSGTPPAAPAPASAGTVYRARTGREVGSYAKLPCRVSNHCHGVLRPSAANLILFRIITMGLTERENAEDEVAWRDGVADPACRSRPAPTRGARRSKSVLVDGKNLSPSVSMEDKQHAVKTSKSRTMTRSSGKLRRWCRGSQPGMLSDCKVRRNLLFLTARTTNNSPLIIQLSNFLHPLRPPWPAGTASLAANLSSPARFTPRSSSLPCARVMPPAPA
jgi:hypothetical protein